VNKKLRFQIKHYGRIINHHEDGESQNELYRNYKMERIMFLTINTNKKLKPLKINSRQDSWPWPV